VSSIAFLVDFPLKSLPQTGSEFAAPPFRVRTGKRGSMNHQDDEEKRALADCNETVDELKNENAELKEENHELREASTTFADLAERLAHELRKDNDTPQAIAPSKPDPEIP
jgi:hypothetical protein